MVSDFASEYGVRLSRDWLSWREFTALLTGLLAADSRLRRRFAEQDVPATDEGDARGW